VVVHSLGKTYQRWGQGLFMRRRQPGSNRPAAAAAAAAAAAG
jgi:hypothetical protein